LIALPLQLDEDDHFHVPEQSAPKGVAKKPGRKRLWCNVKPRRARANGEGKADFKDKKVAKKGAGKKRGGLQKQNPGSDVASAGKRRKFKKRPLRAKEAA